MTQEISLIILGPNHSIRSSLISQEFKDCGEREKTRTIIKNAPPLPTKVLSMDKSSDTGISSGEASVTFRQSKHRILHASEDYSFADIDLRNNDILDNEYCTILVCLAEKSDIKKHIAQIDQIKSIRNGRPFNLVPICQDKKLHLETLKALYNQYPDFYRTSINFDLHKDDYYLLFMEVQEVSLATPVYRELINAANHLDEFDQTILGIHVKEIDNLLGYLITAKRCCGRDALNNYFKKYAPKIQAELSALKKEIENQKVEYKAKLKHIFYNLLCTIGNILVFCSIIGTYHAYQQFSRNTQNHGSWYKFFATNHGEEIQANYASVENALGRMNKSR